MWERELHTVCLHLLGWKQEVGTSVSCLSSSMHTNIHIHADAYKHPHARTHTLLTETHYTDGHTDVLFSSTVYPDYWENVSESKVLSRTVMCPLKCPPGSPSCCWGKRREALAKRERPREREGEKGCMPLCAHTCLLAPSHTHHMYKYTHSATHTHYMKEYRGLYPRACPWGVL